VSKAEFEDRCRLVLVTQPGNDVDAQGEALSQALSGGDVATVIVPQAGRDNDLFQTLAEKLVPIAQDKGVAVIIAGDSRVAGRARADGLHVEGATSDAAEAIEKFSPKLIVGIGNATTSSSASSMATSSRKPIPRFSILPNGGRP
jgi:thiamine-phosphate pyrophosphorylase